MPWYVARSVGTLRRHRLSSRTTCPSSGTIKPVIARRTAFSEPGSENTAVRADRAGAGAAQHRRRADLREAEHAEQLAEPVDALVEDAGDRLVGAVARGEAGAAGGDHDVDRAGLFQHEVADDERLVPDEAAAGDRGGRRPGAALTMASPLVSLASVRVSLMVSTKQAIAAGASRRWSETLTRDYMGALCSLAGEVMNNGSCLCGPHPRVGACRG